MGSKRSTKEEKEEKKNPRPHSGKKEGKNRVDSGRWKKAKRRHKNGKEKGPTGQDKLNELSRREGKPSTFETASFCAYKGLKDASSQS
jgi:hypothetical protein